MTVKLFHKGEMNELYLINWETGYIQAWEDWSQFFKPRQYNWLNFRPIWFEVDYSKLAGEHLTVEFGLLGFNLRFDQLIRKNEQGRKLDKEAEKFESIQKFHENEISKLKLQIKKLKKQLSSS